MILFKNIYIFDLAGSSVLCRVFSSYGEWASL